MVWFSFLSCVKCFRSRLLHSWDELRFTLYSWSAMCNIVLHTEKSRRRLTRLKNLIANNNSMEWICVVIITAGTNWHKKCLIIHYSKNNNIYYISYSMVFLRRFLFKIDLNLRALVLNRSISMAWLKTENFMTLYINTEKVLCLYRRNTSFRKFRKLSYL